MRVRAFVSVSGEKKWNIFSLCQYPSLPPCLIEKLWPRKQIFFIYLFITKLQSDPHVSDYPSGSSSSRFLPTRVVIINRER